MMRCKKHLLFYEVILTKKDYTINPQMTKTELVPPNLTKSTINDIHCQKRFLPDHER